MTITKEQVLSAIGDLASDLDIWIDVSAPDEQDEQIVIIESWEQLSEVQDHLNAKLCPHWAGIRKRYQAAHDIKHASDKIKFPNAHPSNWGQTGGAFASLRTTNAKLAIDAILAHDSPYLIPKTVVEIDSIPGLSQAFSDSYKLCAACQCAINIDYEAAPYLSDGHTCMSCARKAGHVPHAEYLELWALPNGQSYAMGDEIEESKNCEICGADWQCMDQAYELNVMEGPEIRETKEVCHTCILFHSNDDTPEHVLPER